MGSSLGPALEEALVRACRDQEGAELSDIRWFRSDWQRGGGATAGASFARQGEEPAPVVIKLPVGPAERRWTKALAGNPDDVCAPTPRVLATGEALNGYDLGWLVLERLPGLPLASRLDAGGITDILTSLAEFHDRASRIAPLSGAAPGESAMMSAVRAEPDWEALLHRSRDVLHHAKVSDSQRWNHAVHDVQKHLPQILHRWRSRHMHTWCHGDLHAGNAMRRATACVLEKGGRPNGPVSHLGPCVLIDLALIHPGHWLEDILYFERTTWGRPETLRGVNLVSTLARIRRERGHEDHEDYGMLANARRVLSAAAAPGLLEREGNPRYLAHALALIRKLLPQVMR
ncbi:MAG: phosphotransferase family protein [Phycisphaerales bacterium]